MVTYSKYKNRLEQFLQTERGKRFLNFAYSFGAAIVILGAMFKLLHFRFGNEMLFIGMVTECIVFIISAFDTPVRDYQWEQVFPVFDTNNPNDRPGFSTGSGIQGAVSNIRSASDMAVPKGEAPSVSSVQREPYISGGQNPQTHSQQPQVPHPQASGEYASGNHHIDQLSSVSGNVQKFADATETLTKISESLNASYQHIINNSDNISQNSLGYVQQMEALNRNISGLNTIYEIQLKSISGQIDTIEHINRGLNRIKTMYNDAIPDGSVIRDETEKMAGQLRELNQVYARMLQAMTTNMPGAAR